MFGDDAIELNDPMGWEPIAHEIDRACDENETVSPRAEGLSGKPRLLALTE